MAIKAVAQPLRLTIVCLLVHRECSVGTSQLNVSRICISGNLKLLTSRKDANRVLLRDR